MKRNNSKPDTLDLHTMGGAQAEHILRHCIADAKVNKRTEINVITGHGVHTPVGQSPVLLPRSKQYLERSGLQYKHLNPGKLLVTVTCS